jgi:hypothetical protein
MFLKKEAGCVICYSGSFARWRDNFKKTEEEQSCYREKCSAEMV